MEGTSLPSDDTDSPAYVALTEFLEEQGVNRDEITCDKRLLHDFGFEGDDAVDLLVAFSKKFHVDIANFPFKEFFPSERFVCFLELIRRLLNRIGQRPAAGETKRYRPLTVRDLFASIKNGVLRVSE